MVYLDVFHTIPDYQYIMGILAYLLTGLPAFPTMLDACHKQANKSNKHHIPCGKTTIAKKPIGSMYGIYLPTFTIITKCR